MAPRSARCPGRRRTSPTPVCSQLHANLRKSRNRSCKLQKPEANCRTKKPEHCNCWVSSYESIKQSFPVLDYKIKYELGYTDHALLIERWCKRMVYKLRLDAERIEIREQYTHVQCSAVALAKPDRLLSPLSMANIQHRLQFAPHETDIPETTFNLRCSPEGI